MTTPSPSSPFTDPKVRIVIRHGSSGRADSICRGCSGLEWKVVFVIKMNEGELPMSFDQQELERAKESSALQEERRLCFVAWSRASTRLYLSYRCQGDKSEPLNPSRYINDIRRDHVKKLQWDEYEREGAEGEAAAAAGGGSCDPADHSFVKRFPQEQRQTVSHLFNTWSKKVRRRFTLSIRLAAGALTESVHTVGQAAFASQPSRLVAKVKAAALERLAKGKEQSRTSLRALIAGLKEHGEEA